MLLVAFEKKVVVLDVYEGVFLATLHRNDILNVAFVFGVTFGDEVRSVTNYAPARAWRNTGLQE